MGPEVLAQRIADLLRTNAPRGALMLPTAPRVTGCADRDFCASCPASQGSSAAGRLKLRNFEDPATYLKFFEGALHLPTLPGLPRRPSSTPANCLSKRGERIWASRPIKGNPVGPPVGRTSRGLTEWARRTPSCCGELHDTFSLIFIRTFSAEISELRGFS